MRKTLFIALFQLLCIGTKAQLVTSEELMQLKYEAFGTENFKTIAKRLSEHMTLDKNRAINYSKVIEAEGKTKDELFETARLWVTSKFSASNCDIRLVDKEMGCIIAQGYVAKVAVNSTLKNIYSVNLRPVLKIDVKEGRARITFTLSSYSISNEGITSGIFNPNIHSEEEWEVASRYPFGNGYNEKTSAMACVMTHLCATVFIKLAEQALKEGAKAMRQEDEDW